MKNFRKVLALVLVVATLFSFVAMTASAKEYTDADKVSYTEAVDVLTAIGILNGYTDGTYRPTNTIARAEMAKMIAVLANAGKDNIGDLYASACKFADMTGDAVWAKSYVAYCNQIGIVAGRNATTFDPYGKVTGVETAKMLLCMIGFDAKAQGYVGTNWQVNVMRDAEKLGLLNGFAADYKIEKAITREEAAQMMLNALKAPMVVGTVSDSIVNISNSVWIGLVNLKAGTVTITLTDAVNKYNCYVLYGNVLVSNVPVWTNYAGLLVNTNARDCYGNPVTKWSYTNAYGKEVWSAEYAQTPDYYYTDTATAKTDLAKLDEKYVDDIEYWVDGTYFDYENLGLDGIYTALGNDSGRGVEVKIYIQTSVSPATNAAKPATFSNKVIVTVKNTYIGVVEEVVKAAGTFKVNGRTFSNAGYGFAEDDVVLYWLCDDNHDKTGGNELHAAELATPVNADLKTIFIAAGTNKMHDSYIVASGKTYYYAENFWVEMTNKAGQVANLLSNDDNLKSGTYDLYLDKFGNIMYWEYVDNTPETGYAYLVEGTGVYDETGITSSNGKLYTATADTVDFTAKYTENDKIGEKAFNALYEAETGVPVNNSGFDSLGHGVLVHYYVNSKGEKDLNGYVVGTDVAYQVTTDGAVLNTKGNLVIPGSDTIYGDDATKYLVRTWDYATGDFKYTAYDWGKLPYNFCGDWAAADDDKGDTVVANIQYFTKTNTAGHTVLTYVFVNALYTNSTPVNAFITSLYGYTSDDLFNTVLNGYVGYNAVIDGKEGILAVNPNRGDNVTVGNWLHEVKLTVIGLTYNDVPVYASIDDLNATTTGADYAWVYENSRVWQYQKNAVNPDALSVYDVAEGFFVVVAEEKADGSGYDYHISNDPNVMNDYYEVKNGVVNTTLTGGFTSVNSWAIDDGNGNITELYIVVNR